MADTYFANHMAVLKTFLGAAVTEYPWAYALVLFLTSKLVNSQGAAVAIVMPIALNVGMDRSWSCPSFRLATATSSFRPIRRTLPASASTVPAPQNRPLRTEPQLHAPGPHRRVHSLRCRLHHRSYSLLISTNFKGAVGVRTCLPRRGRGTAERGG